MDDLIVDLSELNGVNFDYFYDDYYSKVDGGDPALSPDELWDEMTEEYLYFEEWLNRPDDEFHIPLHVYNEQRLMEN